MKHWKINLALGAFESGYLRSPSQTVFIAGLWDQGSNALRYSRLPLRRLLDRKSRFIFFHLGEYITWFCESGLQEHRTPLDEVANWVLWSLFWSKLVFSRSFFFSICAYVPETIDLGSVTKIEIETGWHTSSNLCSQSFEVLLLLLLFVYLSINSYWISHRSGWPQTVIHSQWWSWTLDPPESLCQVLEV